MVPEDLRRRISILNRTALRSGPAATGGHGGIERPPAGESLLPGFERPRPKTLEELLPGRILENPPSRFYVVERRVSEMHHSATPFLSRFRHCFIQGNLPSILDPTREELVQRDARRWFFLDIETCGLTNSPVFLVGILRFSGTDFHMEQLLARDYSEEPAMLAYLAAAVLECEALVTFNGKTFDWPFLQDRTAVHRVALPEPAVHFDVLHAARKRWGRQLPNCKLQTLERFVCHRLRRGDIPGDQIPDAYHDFVHTARPERMLDILHHNALDLITMSELTLGLFDGEDLTDP